jgi:hypothetical protein
VPLLHPLIKQNVNIAKMSPWRRGMSTLPCVVRNLGTVSVLKMCG